MILLTITVPKLSPYPFLLQPALTKYALDNISALSQLLLYLRHPAIKHEREFIGRVVVVVKVPDGERQRDDSACYEMLDVRAAFDYGFWGFVVVTVSEGFGEKDALGAATKLRLKCHYYSGGGHWECRRCRMIIGKECFGKKE